MSDHRQEFCDCPVPEQILQLVADGLMTDQSWHNDVSPHFEAVIRYEVMEGEQDRETVVQLWSDYPERERREFDRPRFNVYIGTDEQNISGRSVEILSTDDVEKAVSCAKFIVDYFKRFTWQVAVEFTEDHFQLEIGALGGRDNDRFSEEN